MRLIACLDKSNGILFNHRRQSRDANVINDICATGSGRTLCCSAYTSSLFGEGEVHIIEKKDVEQLPADADYFVEDIPLTTLENVEEIVFYHWNRDYPSDTFWEWDPREHGFYLQDKREFRGTSHKRITKEIWGKHKG